MTARLYFNTATGSNVANYTEVAFRLRLLDWELREQAEEGSAAMSTIVFDDPDMDWDVTPWRGWYMVEDASEGSNSIICGGWIADQEIGRSGGDRENPLARLWSVNLTDANAYWAMRVMVGSDCNRPAETDVERIQWLLATNELLWAYDTTTYVQTTTPVAMDAVDYRGQMVSQIMDDAAQASGRNWFTWIDLVGGVRKVMVWYGHDDWAVYDSPLYLTNDPADFVESEVMDGTSLVWPISPDTKLHRDPSRMFDGVYVAYEGGAVYRDTDPRTVIRDFISPSYNVKSSAKAVARALRYLGELDEQDVVVSTSAVVPASKVTQLRAGMRVQFRASHLPGFEAEDTWTWCRILSASVTPVAAGDRYSVAMELVPISPAVASTVVAVLWYPKGNLAQHLRWEGTGANPPAGYTYYAPSAMITYNADPDFPDDFYSMTVNGTGYADITMAASSISVWGGVTVTITFSIVSSVKGVIASDTKVRTFDGLDYWSQGFSAAALGVLLEAGEVIWGEYTCDQGSPTVPAGTGNIAYGLMIAGDIT